MTNQADEMFDPISELVCYCRSTASYSLAELLEKRDIRSKIRELRNFYSLDPATRNQISQSRLKDIIRFAGANVPYYKDVFASISFDPDNLERDISYVKDIPILTKDIIREQGDRMLSQDLNRVHHFRCRSGGSTGPSSVVFYDQQAADYSAAVTLFCRETVGCFRNTREVHFSAKFESQSIPWRDRVKESVKCSAHNRHNIYVADWSKEELNRVIAELVKVKAYLVHGHPSTLNALLSKLKEANTSMHLCEVFESSGELLNSTLRDEAAIIAGCQVVNRYGLAELGVVGYEMHNQGKMYVMESECWMEEESSPSREGAQLIGTSLRNRLMPLIRYQTGDLGNVRRTRHDNNLILDRIMGRSHDRVLIDNKEYPTHFIMDILQHKVGGINQFQIRKSNDSLDLLIVLEAGVCPETVRVKVHEWFQTGVNVRFIEQTELERVGHRDKFRYYIEYD